MPANNASGMSVGGNTIIIIQRLGFSKEGQAVKEFNWKNLSLNCSHR